MVSKKFYDVFTLDRPRITYDNIVYEFRLENYENTDGFAKCMIKDITNDEAYHSNGWLEINGHIIITKWTKEYDYNRDNWICTKDLIIEIR